MPNFPKHSRSSNSNSRLPLDAQQYAWLKAEAKTPYKGLRQFFYLAFGASGLIGAFVFLTQLAAGQNVTSTFPNFALQVGVVALMGWLFRLENRR